MDLLLSFIRHFLVFKKALTLTLIQRFTEEGNSLPFPSNKTDSQFLRNHQVQVTGETWILQQWFSLVTQMTFTYIQISWFANLLHNNQWFQHVADVLWLARNTQNQFCLKDVCWRTAVDEFYEASWPATKTKLVKIQTWFQPLHQLILVHLLINYH